MLALDERDRSGLRKINRQIKGRKWDFNKWEGGANNILSSPVRSGLEAMREQRGFWERVKEGTSLEKVTTDK